MLFKIFKKLPANEKLTRYDKIVEYDESIYFKEKRYSYECILYRNRQFETIINE